MKKILLLIVLIVQIFALETIQATKQNILKLEAQKIPIVDIRLPSEWQSTGTIPNAKKITFFTQRGGINPNFLNELKKYDITPNSKFAVICRTGHRSKIAAQILEKNGYTKIIDLKGGMFSLFKSLLKEMKSGK